MNLAGAVGSLLVTAFNVLRDIALAVFAAIQPYIPAIQSAIGQLAEWVGGVLAGAFDFLASFIQGTVIPGLTTLGGWLADAIPVAIQFLADTWTNVLQPAIAAAWGFIQDTLLPLFGELVNWLQTAIPAGLSALSDFWQQHGDTILTIAQTAWQTIQDVISAVLDTISGLWTAWNQAREGDWRGFGETLRSIWDASWEAVKNVIATVGPQIVATLVQLATDAYNAFTSIDWGAVGTAVVQGIANGITAGMSWVADAARRVAQSALRDGHPYLIGHDL
jgi:phage-related protein